MAVSTSVYEPQFGAGYSFEDAVSDCGPVAAIAFARANGRSPTRREAKQLAGQVGWTPDKGMAGPGSEKLLLAKMGIDTDLAPQADESRAASEVKAGKPVIVSTGLHFYTLTDYDPKSGRFYVGPSGTAVRGGSEWMSLAEMDKASRDRGLEGINGALYLNGRPISQERQRFLEANTDLPSPAPERAVAPVAPAGEPPDFVAQVQKQQQAEDAQQPPKPPAPTYDPQAAMRDAKKRQDDAANAFSLDWLNQLGMPKTPYRLPDAIDVAMPKLPIGFG